MATSSAIYSCVHVLYAPLPDEPIPAEESAAFEFARRATEIFNKQQGAIISDDQSQHSIDISRLTDDASHISRLIEESELLILVVSCGADGSIHRNVRKITRQLNKATRDVEAETTQETNNHLVVVLLGHAVCHNSANQMDHEIFRAGRKLAKMLGAEKSGGKLLEIQAELEPPEDKFDPFLQRHCRETRATKT